MTTFWGGRSPEIHLENDGAGESRASFLRRCGVKFISKEDLHHSQHIQLWQMGTMC